MERELQRKQPVSRKQAFWTNVASIRAEQVADDYTTIAIEDIWADVRDSYMGREAFGKSYDCG